VPGRQTINIILEAAYNHQILPPPSLPSMKELLTICTTKTPFSHNEKTYIQIDGVSMGCPLRAMSADFYCRRLGDQTLASIKGMLFRCTPSKYFPSGSEPSQFWNAILPDLNQYNLTKLTGMIYRNGSELNQYCASTICCTKAIYWLVTGCQSITSTVPGYN